MKSKFGKGVEVDIQVERKLLEEAKNKILNDTQLKLVPVDGQIHEVIHFDFELND